MRRLLFIFVIVALSSLAFASKPTRLPRTRVRHTSHKRHRIRIPRWQRAALASPIRGSHDSLVRQNSIVDEEGLERIQDDDQLLQLTADERLVALPENGSIGVTPTLPENRRFCRPWTRSFLATFAQAHWRKFHRSLIVTSAVRTVEFQQELQRYNGNAAGIEGETASPHLTGATIDVAKQGMTRAELKWARNYLLRLQQLGKLDAEEEFRQPVFHITVYNS
ncbi:MAG TPA: DUF5715 family protein, partial [Acidobacteriaceae bacterium]|nr:DUF5715 family protein [Acidobacteriaceae bacterium]